MISACAERYKHVRSRDLPRFGAQLAAAWQVDKEDIMASRQSRANAFSPSSVFQTPQRASSSSGRRSTPQETRQESSTPRRMTGAQRSDTRNGTGFQTSINEASDLRCRCLECCKS